MAYHYKDSGLDNVYLENGYKVVQTPYGEAVSIANTDGLHRLIADWLIGVPKRLNGAELRFLRLYMELTQRDLAAMLGQEEQSIRRWEKARTREINGSADRLLRALTNECLHGDGSVKRMVERLAELNVIEAPKVCLREDEEHWSVAA